MKGFSDGSFDGFFEEVSEVKDDGSYEGFDEGSTVGTKDVRSDGSAENG